MGKPFTAAGEAKPQQPTNAGSSMFGLTRAELGAAFNSTCSLGTIPEQAPWQVQDSESRPSLGSLAVLDLDEAGSSLVESAVPLQRLQQDFAEVATVLVCTSTAQQFPVVQVNVHCKTATIKMMLTDRFMA